MAKKITSNSYEEARKQQLLENKKRFEDLGILNISKSLSSLSKCQKISKLQREVKPKIIVEPRRSTRARNLILTYQNEVGIGLPSTRSIEEVKVASYEARVRAIKFAAKLQCNLQSKYPSFVKSMVHTQVYDGLRLSLPTRFCTSHLPKSKVSMVLEDEDGNEYEVVFSSSSLGGGWKAFVLDHKLDVGDALVFELVEQTRFKIYIVKASYGGSQDHDDDMSNGEEEADEKTLDSPTENMNKPSAKHQSQPKRDLSYLARELEELKFVPYEARVQAIKSAAKLQCELQYECPFFVKLMVRSHVHDCFLLVLPCKFCRSHLPKSKASIVLEDEDGKEYEAVVFKSRLVSGWKAFVLEHKLDDGDALVFELVEKTRFKIYIIKASHDASQDHDDDDMSNEIEEAERVKGNCDSYMAL